MAATAPLLLLLVGAALLLAVAGISLVGHAVLSYRDDLSRRVDELIAERTSFRPVDRKAQQIPQPDGANGAVHGERELRQKFLGLGLPAAWANWALPGLRLVLGVLAASIALLISYAYWAPTLPVHLAIAVGAGGVLGWLLARLVLKLVARQRLAAVERALPDAIELLVVSVEAGLGLEEGLDRLIPELGHTQAALADELRTTAADLKILPSREEALTRLAERVGTKGVRSVAMTLAQTMRYGTPLAQALRLVATELRNDALLLLEERANRIPVLMTVPMIFFMLPATFLIVGGPAVLRLVDSIGP